eukprot:708169-Prorocentrum_minimum.AAC.3
MAKRDREWVSGGQLGVAVDNDTPDGLRRAICDILEPKETVIRLSTHTVLKSFFSAFANAKECWDCDSVLIRQGRGIKLYLSRAALKRLRPTPGNKTGQRNKQQKKRDSKPKARWEVNDDEGEHNQSKNEGSEEGDDAKKQPDTKELFDRLTECVRLVLMNDSGAHWK